MNIETTLARTLPVDDGAKGELAHRDPVALGVLVVEPALRRLSAPGVEPVTLQPLAMRVLLALVDAKGATLSRDDLVRLCWGQRIVGDDAVHRIISTLRRDLARASGPGANASAATIVTVPRVGYRLEMPGAPAAAEEAGAPPPAPVHPRRRRWLMAAAGVLGVAVVGAVALTTPGKSAVHTIAVVAQPGAASFASALTGDLAQLGGAMPSLAFVEPEGVPDEDTLLLQVALDRRPGAPTAQLRLVSGGERTVVWSHEFAGADTLPELRERVANGVTGLLQCGLDRAVRFDDPVGLRLYLGACEGLQTRDFERARAFAEQITVYRPSSPAGWACLANSTIFAEAEKGAVGKAVLDKADAYAAKALAADPRSGLAYVALGMAASWRNEPKLAIYERGLRVDPDFAMLQKHYARALSAAGMVSAAPRPALRALALQPHDPDHHQLAVAALLDAGRREEAIALSDRSLARWRYDKGLAIQRLGLSFHAEDPGAALAALRSSAVARDPRVRLIEQSLRWRAAPDRYDWGDFDRLASETSARDPRFAWQAAHLAALMQEPARALAWLERAPADAYLAWAPLFAPEAAAVRRDPRFIRKMAEVGMLEQWRKSDRWPDFCREPGLGYDCRREAERLRPAPSAT